MGKHSAFDDSDEEEQHAEEGPQEVAPPETGAASSGQTTRTPVESSRRGSSSGRPSGHLKRKREVPKVVEVDPLSFSLPAIHELSSLDDLLKEGYADPGRGTDLFEDVPAGHAQLTFDPPRVECSELPEAGAARLEDGMRQAVQAVNTFVTICTGLGEQLASAQRTAASEANRARDAEVMFKASEGKRARLEEERKRLEEEVARMKAQLADAELTHRLQMESLLATSVPKSRLDTYILAGVQRYLGSPEFALRINDVMDPAMERGARKVVLEIAVAQKKNEHIQPILEKYADREKKGKTSAVRLPVQGPETLPGYGFCHSPYHAADFRSLCLRFEARGHPEHSGQSLVRLSDAEGDKNASQHATGTGGGTGGLEGQLEDALQTFRASELYEARKAVLEAKAENDRLDKLWRDTEAYWEDHLKNSIQLEMLANNRLRTFEAKIRKKKKDEGLAEPDPEDFIPRNYFESVLVHLRKAYALVAVKWDRSSNKIKALRAYAGQLQTVLESAIFFIVEMGKEYDFAALWPEPCPAMRDEPTSPTREAERLMYENDALFFELGRGSR
ncbi:OLC1v1036068C1 [Oldenlandia corymbosa var. corymbosa]|uniref:OLC1v1036068C1 n=1 Tax=Oldenlandia corymbosa var. corymbosa TaxID=529605 RepID=A0AAV1CUJ7_OLDCO|nr:OLC1v1036068C1 [Oldenlandia corymbosa var. corymbosa]